MKNLKYLVASGAFLVFCFCTETFFAEAGQGRGLNSRYGKMYDSQTVETLIGEVTRVDQTGCGQNIILKTENGEILVHLGPNFFLDHQDVKIKVKDKVTVTGSKVTFEGQTFIVAAEVKRGNDVLILRSMKGVPVWSGWRRE